jgi:hypothetical protein
MEKESEIKHESGAGSPRQISLVAAGVKDALDNIRAKTEKLLQQFRRIDSMDAGDEDFCVMPLEGCCPYCGSTSVEGESMVTLMGNEACQQVICLKCGKNWEAYYKLSGIKLD